MKSIHITSSAKNAERIEIPRFAGAIALAIPDAVRATGLSRATLYREIAAGRLKVRKCGKRTVILTSELEDFLCALPVVLPERL